MIVEHYNSDTGEIEVLLMEQKFDAEPDTNDPKLKLEYWEWRVMVLKRAIKGMPRCKQRQQVGLGLDEARKQANIWRGRTLG